MMPRSSLVQLCNAQDYWVFSIALPGTTRIDRSPKLEDLLSVAKVELCMAIAASFVNANADSLHQ